MIIWKGRCLDRSLTYCKIDYISVDFDKSLKVSLIFDSCEKCINFQRKKVEHLGHDFITWHFTRLLEKPSKFIEQNFSFLLVARLEG